MKINSAYLKNILKDSDYEDIVDVISDMINKSENGTHLANPKKIKDFFESYKIAKSFECLGDNINVSYEIFSPFNDTAIITIVCKEICFKSAKDLINISKVASTLGVSPRIDGYLELAFSFTEISKKVR